MGVEGNKLLAIGTRPKAVLSRLQDRDEGHRQRQVHVMAKDGTNAAYTGADCIDWAGHKAEENLSVAGNMLAGPQVLEAMLASYHDNAEKNFAERMLAMEAAEAAGGDKEDGNLASLTIHRGEDFPG